MNEKYKILVVDDQPINLKIAQLFLNKLGYVNITIAKNGKKALELMNDDFDIILLDIGLPDINGFNLCKMLREKVNYKNIPIIAVTAFTENIHEMCTIAGIDGVINKPVDINILEEMLLKKLEIKKNN